jgi:hypothetical protein
MRESKRERVIRSSASAHDGYNDDGHGDAAPYGHIFRIICVWLISDKATAEMAEHE